MAHVSSSAQGSGASRRRWWLRPLVVVLVALLVPVAELVVVVALAREIGSWAVLGIIVATSLVGAAVLARQGPRTWRLLRESMRVERLASGRLPGVQLLDGALVLLGGFLLMVPGLLTDVLGIACLLPFVRPVLRRLLLVWVRRRAGGVVARVRPPSAGRVVTGEVVTGQVVGGDAADAEPPRSSRKETGRPVVERSLPEAGVVPPDER